MNITQALLTAAILICLSACSPRASLADGGDATIQTKPAFSEKELSDLADALYHRKLPEVTSLIEGRTLSGVLLEGDVSPLRMLLTNPILEPGHSPPPPSGEGTLRVLRKMLELGADPNYADHSGITVLMATAAFGEDTSIGFQIVRELVRGGADSNAQTTEGQTALHLAAFTGNIRLAEALLAEGANPKIMNIRGESPSNVAMARGHAKLAEKLAE